MIIDAVRRSLPKLTDNLEIIKKGLEIFNGYLLLLDYK